MSMNEQSLAKISSAMDKIARQGITVNIRFPAETDKFALDLAALAVKEGLEAIADAISTEVMKDESES